MREKNIKPPMLSDRLTKVLKTRKMSKSELARRVGVTPQAVNNWFSRGESLLSRLRTSLKSQSTGF
ncbi:helix-turn-helix transcriptional regulator [Enterobacter hormaechei]|uniref:helix-turn-helix domain-containing protein n=1 Tax=Enterobacter hormaechei TaxID=158836 RepID=UPI00313438CD